MSYDLELHRKSSSGKIAESELEKLEDRYIFKITDKDAQDNILSFIAKFRDDQPDWIAGDDGFEVTYQDGGFYWMYISYGADKEMFDYFRKLAGTLATDLDLVIFDPQIGEEVDPTDFGSLESQNNERISATKVTIEYLVEPSK